MKTPSISHFLQIQLNINAEKAIETPQVRERHVNQLFIRGDNVVMVALS